MSSMKADPEHVFISCDLASGEPTCTAHYSQDKNYYDATFGMVGKAPYYTPEGVLKIDNLYYTVMSVSPMGRARMREAYAASYDGTAFSDRWQRNETFQGEPFQDWIKGQLKREYAFHKMGALGLSYSMGPRKFQQAAYDAGYVIELLDAKRFFQSYWTLFSGIKAFADQCALTVKNKGFLVNAFGYRLIPDKDYKAFNYFIQSSVSGIMHVVCSKFFDLAPYCEFLLVIHDEVIFSCPKEKVQLAREAMKKTTEELNHMLSWRVDIRTGFAIGENLYDAK